VRDHSIPFFRLRSTKASQLLLGILLVLCTPLLISAQAGRGSISGTISDQGGAVVAEAQVVLLNKATGVTLHTVTSAAGLYTFILSIPACIR
jgi:hypothetical protein